MSRLCRLKSYQGIGDDGKWAYAEIIRLRQLLFEATCEIESWAAYAPEYFQQKHDLEGVLAKYKKEFENDNTEVHL